MKKATLWLKREGRDGGEHRAGRGGAAQVVQDVSMLA